MAELLSLPDELLTKVYIFAAQQIRSLVRGKISVLLSLQRRLCGPRRVQDRMAIWPAELPDLRR